MERLDSLVAKVLADARQRMDKRAGGFGAPGKAARIVGGDKASALARAGSHSRSSSRSQPKRAATANAKRETATP